MNTSINITSIVSTLIMALGLFAAGTTAHAQAENETAKADAYAVVFYADWCGSCKAMDPKLKEARASLADESVLFVTFNMTDENTKKQTAMLANALNLEDHFSENAGKTGFLLLIDPKNNEVVDRITKNDSAEAMKKKIAAATKS